METIHLASKYASAVQERFYKDSFTQDMFSKDMDMEFTGVRSVKVYEVNTAPLNDYKRSGTSRYGTPEELTDNIQEFIMTQDKSFTYTIDKGNAKEQFNIKKAGESLKRQMREVVTPFIDKYRMQKWAEGAGIVVGLSSAPTKSTIGGLIMDGTVALDNALAPSEGRTLYISASYKKILKLCDEFNNSDGLTTKAIGKGVIGEFDGMVVKSIPDSYMPYGAYFMIIIKNSAISPMKLDEYKIHTDPPGISGDLVEGRVMFDAFVKGTKANGIYVAAPAANTSAAVTVSIAAHEATITGSGTIMYTDDGSDPRYSTSAKKYDNGTKPTTIKGTIIRAYQVESGKLASPVAKDVDDEE